MAYIAICRDHPARDTSRLRKTEKAAHFAYIETILAKLLVAGPLPSEDDGAHVASLFIYSVDSADEARELLQADPYYQAGIYGEIELQPYIPAAGQWIGGTIW